MPTPARQLALHLLATVERAPGTLADQLATAAVEALPPRERAFLHELVLGTLRLRGWLDFQIEVLLDRPLDDLQPVLLKEILRLGAHQILHLRVPQRAAVSEAVELAAERAPRAKGLVNAVLRHLARQGPRAAPDPMVAPLAWLESAGSVPRWLAERWLAQLGSERAVARATALLRQPPIAFRLNPRVADAWQRVQDAELAPTPLVVPGAFRATQGHPQALAAAGVIALQDQGSQLIAHLAAPGRLVLDVCAAPGGKAMLIADLLGSAALVVAAEPALRRLQIMRQRLVQWGSPRVLCVAANGMAPPFRSQFDVVLVDAPCTGLGTLARHPDIRWRLRPQDIDRHARRQRDLLATSAGLVRPGGRLVYSTCSLEPEETGRVLEDFSEHTRGFRRAPGPSWAAPFAAEGALRLLPERDGGDGFFAVALQKD